MSKNFYRAFEDLHRGQRADIIRRLQVYLPFVLPIAKANPNAPCLDLGCGRGEWLQLLTDENLRATGVDLDVGMLAAAQEQGLQVQHADAIEALKQAADRSLSVVSAFHLVEHLPFESLQELVHQALRVLVPGGLLIMETPNPDNLRVATHNFYLDPSHIKPIPASLLSFVAEHAGFARTKILGLQESAALRFQAEIQLQDVLAGASPDYAVIAQTSVSADHADQFNAAFDREYGITTTELAQSFTKQQIHTMNALRTDIHELRELIHSEVNQRQQLEQKIVSAHLRSDWLANEIQVVRSSLIWRLMRLRPWARNQFVKLRQQGLKNRWMALLRKAGWLKEKPSPSSSKAD